MYVVKQRARLWCPLWIISPFHASSPGLLEGTNEKALQKRMPGLLSIKLALTIRVIAVCFFSTQVFVTTFWQTAPHRVTLKRNARDLSLSLVTLALRVFWLD